MVQITEKAYETIHGFCKKVCPSEVGGLLLGEMTKDGEYFIKDAITLKQEDSVGTFEITDDDMARFTKEADGKTLSSVIGWWHTHGNGSTFWSGTDDDTSKRLARFLHGKCVSIVVSLSILGKFKSERETRCRVDVETRNNELIFVDDVKPEIRSFSFSKKRLNKKISAKIKKNVEVKKLFFQKTQVSSQKDFYSFDDDKCPACRGRGYNMFDDWCKKCDGLGVVHKGG